MDWFIGVDFVHRSVLVTPTSGFAARGERSDQKRHFTIGTQTLQNTHSRKSSTDSQAVLDPGMDPICQYCSRYAVHTAVTAAASRRIGLSSITIEKLVSQAFSVVLVWCATPAPRDRHLVHPVVAPVPPPSLLSRTVEPHPGIIGGRSSCVWGSPSFPPFVTLNIFMDGGSAAFPSLTELHEALAGFTSDEQAVWATYLGEDVSALDAAAVTVLLLWYLSHLPNLLRQALLHFRVGGDPPALHVYTDAQRKQRDDISVPDESGELPRSPGHPPGSQPHDAGASSTFDYQAFADSHTPSGRAASSRSAHPVGSSSVPSSGTTSFLSSRERDLERRFDARLAHMEDVMGRHQRASDERIEHLERQLAAARAEVAAERESFGSRLQQMLLDVDLVLPSAASAKLLKKARAFEISDVVMDKLRDYDIVPADGLGVSRG